MSQQPVEAESEQQEALEGEKEQQAEGLEQQDLSETAQAAQTTLKELMHRMRARARVKVVCEHEDRIEFVVTGLDASMLVGKKGQTLDSLQYLVNRIVGKRLGEHKLIVIDSDGYRERREASLVEMAKRLSEKVRVEGKIVALNPMSPRDRRIIHLTLKDEPSVSTRSEGQGDERRLLIVPEE